ncbi:MAG: NAD(P)/FAD-dependent oxidoreductase, partial [Bacteroidales bacterium]|nr:NAD(P)/FAD-dependent oxidoreductase [Bacteroidales bacterium]
VTNRKELARNLIGRIPGLEEAVEKFWTSTQATWERYTGTPGGSAYGIRKKDASCYVHPRTPVPGLYLTGQNCGLHGILGVSETAIVTCREIVGEELLNKTMNL